jgi:hypothetical protein
MINTTIKVYAFFTAVVLTFYSNFVSAADQLTFDGSYEYRSDQESLEIIGKQVCFYPSQPTSTLIPRSSGDQRLAWFCFSNSQKAANMLGFSLSKQSKACGIRGTAKVTVVEYKRYTGEGDGNDVATLKVVLEKSPPQALPCPK